MAVRYISWVKACRACEYWDGVRKASFDKAWIEVQLDAQTGVCQNPNALFGTKGKPMKSNYSSCPRFEKWSALK